MQKGNYNTHRADFSAYAVSCFIPHLFSSSPHLVAGCGAGALALVTGVSPKTIQMKNGRSHFSDHFMINFLRSHGFSTKALTMCNLSNSRKPVGESHVLLISQLIRRNLATWSIIFRGLVYHNLDIYSLEVLSFLNKPILTAYLITHPSWRFYDDSPTRPDSTAKGRLNFGNLKEAGLFNHGRSSTPHA